MINFGFYNSLDELTALLPCLLVLLNGINDVTTTAEAKMV